MRQRLRSLAAWAGGLTEELLCLFALLLIAGGFWLMPSWRAGSLLVPGIVVLWMFMPARVSFVVRQSDPAAPKRRAQ